MPTAAEVKDLAFDPVDRWAAVPDAAEVVGEALLVSAVSADGGAAWRATWARWLAADDGR